MSGSRTCPKCTRRMETGFRTDTGDHGAPTVVGWYPGAPDRRWWGLKIDKKARRQVTTWRCTGCGFLEDYAG